MAKGEIGWKSVNEDGIKLQKNAKLFGGEWKIYEREKRFDTWEENPSPSLEDWKELLDGVQRRIPRGLFPPLEETKIKRRMRELFPDEDIED